MFDKNKLVSALNSVGIFEEDFFSKEIPMPKFEKLTAVLDLNNIDAGHLLNMYEENPAKGTWVPKWKTWHLNWDEYLNNIAGLM